MTQIPAQDEQENPPTIEDRVAALENLAASLEADNAQLKRQLTAQKTQTTIARNKLAAATAEISARPAEATAREIPLSPAVPFTRAELMEMVDAAEKVEIVATDGLKEILGIPPLAIKAGSRAFRTIGDGRLVLSADDYTVHGPGPGTGPYALAGWALFIDDELAAWTARPSQLNIGSGQAFNLAGDVVF